MMNSKLILEKLRENNPFASQNSPLPWDNRTPDLQQLNRETYEEIGHLIRHKRREPYSPVAGLIIGDTGSGKTHMLTRILRKLRDNGNPAIFVLVKTFRDYESVMQHLLSEIFISLKRIHSKGRSQFDVVAEEVMNVYRERRLSDGFDDLTRLDTRVYLARDMPGLDRDFLKGLLLYIGTKDESVRLDILNWLEHGLDDEDSQRLGLPLRDTDSMTFSKRENNAEKILISLGIVLGYAKIPMIICFDQLENMKDKRLIDAWGNLISLFVNDIPGVLPLCFVRPDTWNNVFLPVLDSSVTRRLEGNKIIMKACAPKYTNQLIHDRITNAFDKEESEEIYQWLIQRTEGKLKHAMPPAEIIQKVNRIITGNDTDIQDEEHEIIRTIRAAYEEEYKKIEAYPEGWPPNTDNLTLALDVWLNSHNEFEAVKGTGKYIKIQGIYNGRKYAFVILTAKGHSTVSAGLRHGMEFIKEYPDGKCFYITEDKTHKRTWKQANENLAKFKNMGGHVIMLDKDTRINWYALTALINRTDNGDVNLYLLSGSRTASRDDIKSFVCTLNLIPEIFTGNAKKIQPKVIVVHEAQREESKIESVSVIEPDVLGVNLKSILNSSPMRMITVEKATELLSCRRIAITRNELLLFLKNNAGAFRTFSSKSNNDVLITFAKTN